MSTSNSSQFAAQPFAVERIVVALDSSPQGRAALRAAAQLAAQLQAELHGLFVEDDNLIRLCKLPFSQEIGRFSARSRPLESQTVERQLRALAQSLRQALAQEAHSRRISWTFQVTRGNVTNELVTAAESALLLSVGGLGSTFENTGRARVQMLVERSARPVLVLGDESRLDRPFTLVYTGSASANRAVELAVQLAQRTGKSLNVLLQIDAENLEQTVSTLGRSLTMRNVRAQFLHQSPTTTAVAELLAYSKAGGLLILPSEYAELLTKLRGPVLIVP